jgi:hypothetical protein
MSHIPQISLCSFSLLRMPAQEMTGQSSAPGDLPFLEVAWFPHRLPLPACSVTANALLMLSGLLRSACAYAMRFAHTVSGTGKSSFPCSPVTLEGAPWPRGFWRRSCSAPWETSGVLCGICRLV